MAVLGYVFKLGNALLRNKKFCKWKIWGNYMYLMKMLNVMDIPLIITIMVELNG